MATPKPRSIMMVGGPSHGKYAHASDSVVVVRSLEAPPGLSDNPGRFVPATSTVYRYRRLRVDGRNIEAMVPEDMTDAEAADHTRRLTGGNEAQHQAHASNPTD